MEAGLTVPLLIGSTATNIWYPGFRRGDVDCYAPRGCFLALQRSGADPRLATYHNGLMQLCDWPAEQQARYSGITMNVASREILLLIKRLHLEFPVKWLKNVQDYIFLCKQGVTPSKELLQVYSTRVKFLRRHFTLPHSNLPPTGSLEEAVELRKSSPLWCAHLMAKDANIDLIDLL